MKTNPAFFTSAAGIFISQVKEALLSIGVPVLLVSSLLLLTANKVQADSNTWESQGSSTDWNTASNWSLDTVPDTTGEIATFNGSGTSTVALSANASPDSIDFTSPNSGYLIETSTYNLTLSGAGIEGNSSNDTFIVSTSSITGEGILAFANSASAGSGTQIINPSFGGVALGGVTDFLGSSTADTANITNEGSGGHTNFESSSSAGSASIVNEAATSSSQDGGGSTAFGNSSMASNATVLNEGSTVAGLFGGVTLLADSAVASNGTFINQNGAIGNSSVGYSAGLTILTGNASAGTAVFQNLGGGTSLDGGKDVGPLYGGVTFLEGSATAASGTFNTFGGSVSGATGGDVFFTDTSSAGSATFNTSGGSASGAGGGELGFENNSSAGSSTLIANGGTNGGAGAEIFFDANSTGGTAQVDVMGNGELDISNHASGTVAIGSLEGTGNVSLGANTLSVGQSTVTSVFSGVISDGGQGGSLAGSGSV